MGRWVGGVGVAFGNLGLERQGWDPTEAPNKVSRYKWWRGLIEGTQLSWLLAAGPADTGLLTLPTCYAILPFSCFMATLHPCVGV